MTTAPAVARPASNLFLAKKFNATYATILILISEISIEPSPRP